MIRFAFSACGFTDSDLLEKSYTEDEHQSVFSSCGKFEFDDSVLTKLRKECLHFICNVSEKYCTSCVNEEQDEIDVSQKGNSQHTFCSDDSSFDESCFSSEECISNDSGSIYIPDVEIERDENDSWCESCHEE